MPTFLTDPPPAVYLVLGFVALITGVIAAQRQDRKSAVPFLAALAVLLAVFLLDRFIDSREGSVKSAQAMADAADHNNPDGFVAHVGDTLTYHGEGAPVTATRSELKASPFWNILRQFNAHVAVWNFSRDDVKQIDDNTVEIGFMAKGETRGEMKGVQLYVRGTFKKQLNSGMKMTEFRTFDAIDNRKPFNIPGFPK